MSDAREGKVEAEGKSFGPYTVYERIGVGGMATVHRAKERGIAGFQRTIALKRLLPHLGEDEEFIRAFVREARFASLLTHGNICQIFDLGRVGNDYYIAMEYIEGRDLRKILKRARRAAGPPPLSFTLFVMMELCDALSYAHQRTDEGGNPLGLVHRDISPSNLIMSKTGHLKVIDFGIAKATGDQGATRSGAIKGKLAYMAPEALTAQGLDARSDLFSVGVVCYELLTARPLFADKNDFKVIQNIQSYTPPPPSARNREVPPEMDEVALTALEKNPTARWQSAGDMLRGLRDVARQHNLHPTSQDVLEWMDLAFSLDEGDRKSQYQRSDSSISAVSFPSASSGGADSLPYQKQGTIESFLRASTPGSHSSLLDVDAPPANLGSSSDLGEELLDIPGDRADGESERTLHVPRDSALWDIPDLGEEEPDGLTTESGSPYAHRPAQEFDLAEPVPHVWETEPPVPPLDLGSGLEVEIEAPRAALDEGDWIEPLNPPALETPALEQPPGGLSPTAEMALKNIGIGAPEPPAANPALESFVTFKAPAPPPKESEADGGKPLVDLGSMEEPEPSKPRSRPRITGRIPVAVTAARGKEESAEESDAPALSVLKAAEVRNEGDGKAKLVAWIAVAVVAIALGVLIGFMAT